MSRAARRLNISQSAASGALARLRRHFGDDLLERRGTSYELTSTAQRLAPQAREAVAVTASLISSARSFDASTSRREFVIVSSEYGQTLHAPELVRRVALAAPGVRIAFRGMEVRSSSEDWLAKVDGWLGPRDSLSNTPGTGAASDRWVCVASVGSSVPDDLSIADVSDHRWVLPTTALDRDVPWRKRLLAYGVDIDVGVTTESFGAVPFLVAGTEMVGVMQERLARKFADTAGVRILECPWEMRPLIYTMWWDAAHEHDPAHRWLRDQVARSLTD